MPEPVTIAAIEAENVKRVRAVELTPTPSGLTVIGGSNAQGKTSVLDAITWALGGDRYRPENPKRAGSMSDPHVRIELSDGIVAERKGAKSALTVTDTTGRKAGQRLLDEVIGKIALDLPKFLGGSDKERTEILLQTLGIEGRLEVAERDIAKAEQDRLVAGREAKRLTATAESLPGDADGPTDTVSVYSLTQELESAQEQVAKARNLAYRIECNRYEIDRLKAKIKIVQDQIDADTAEAERLNPNVPDVESLRQQIADAETTNRERAENAAKRAAIEQAQAAEEELATANQAVERARASRKSLMDGAPMPLDGLAVDDGLISYNGQPWSQMSGAERLRVACAVAHAAKPSCGFVLVDGLEQMDPDTLADFGRWAQGIGLQVIGTRVGSDGACTVIIEDGRAVEPAGSKAQPEAQVGSETPATQQQWKGF